MNSLDTLQISSASATPIPPCYVVVRKLTLTEISRIGINPFFVVFRCGQCRHRMHYGPKCSCCTTYYHYRCATIQKKCCGRNILPVENKGINFRCSVCKGPVQFGPQCSVCSSMYHYTCLSPFDSCCRKKLFQQLYHKSCAICNGVVDLGPRCPLCGLQYHFDCVNGTLNCCGIRIQQDDLMLSCRKCCKALKMFAPICPICGIPSHRSCMQRSTSCCGKIFGDAFIVPSFKPHFKKGLLRGSVHDIKMRKYKTKCSAKALEPPRKRAKKQVSCLKRACRPSRLQTALDTALCDIEFKLESSSRSSSPPDLDLEEVSMRPGPSKEQPPELKKAISNRKSARKKKPTRPLTPRRVLQKGKALAKRKPPLFTPVDQTEYSLDHIRIVQVKTEPESSTVEIQDSEVEVTSPPQLPAIGSPMVTSSSTQDNDSDTLESLFYFLYNVVRKFPPYLQAQVKFQLFKSVSDAELQLHLGHTQHNPPG